MTGTELYIETEDGKQYIGDVKSVKIDTETDFDGRAVTQQEYQFQVSSLIET